MDNWVFVFIITFIGSFVLVYGIGFSLSGIFGRDDIDFIYLLLFIVQFSFTTTILFQILHKVKQLEKKGNPKEYTFYLALKRSSIVSGIASIN